MYLLSLHQKSRELIPVKQPELIGTDDSCAYLSIARGIVTGGLLRNAERRGSVGVRDREHVGRGGDSE